MGLSEKIESMEVAAGDQLRAPRDAQVATRTVRVMTYNILSGGWPRIDALEAVMRDARADIIGIQEVAPRTLDALAKRLGMWGAISPSRHGAPVALLSRWPLRDVRLHGDVPLRNALVEAVIAPEDAAPLHIFVTHLAASYSKWRGGEGQRVRELAFILDRMRASAGEPQLLMGDFNSLPPGERLLASQLIAHVAQNDVRRAKGEDMTGHPSLRRILPRPVRPLAGALLGLARTPLLAQACDLAAAVYVPRAVVRQTRAAGYTDLYTVAHPDPAQRGMSCPSENPAGRIDYIFANDALATGLVACDLLSDTPASPVSLASDHRPMLATLTAPAPRITPAALE